MTEGVPDPNRKITLPTSGLAEEILGRAGAPPEAPHGPEGETGRHNQAKSAGEMLHLVGFFLGQEEYALEIVRVQEIIRAGRWTWVPNAPAHVKGVINLRGRIIPVMDLKARIGMGYADVVKDSRIIVVEAGDKTVGGGKALGLLVDRVSQVFKMPGDVVEPPPEEISGAGNGYINGVGKMDGRLIILLDFENVIWKDVECVR